MRTCLHFRNPAVLRTHTRPTIHLARLLVPTKVCGPGGIGKFALTNDSAIMLMGRGSPPDWRRHGHGPQDDSMGDAGFT